MSWYSKDDLHKMANVGFAPKFQINERGAMAGCKKHFAIDGFGKSWNEKRDEQWLKEAEADQERQGV